MRVCIRRCRFSLVSAVMVSLLAGSALAERPLTITPNEFEGTDSQRINQAIQAAAGKGLTVVIPKLNQKPGATSETWLLDSAILVRDNTTLELNHCHIKLSDRCRDNIIRSANCGMGITDIKPMKHVHIYGVGNVLLEGADHPRATGDSAKTLGKHSFGTDAGVEGKSQTGDWRNIGILFAKVENFSIKNLHLKDSHSWAISLERSGPGRIEEIRFTSHGFKMIDGKRKAIHNQDGLDLRQGCHDIIVEGITGETGDDLVAVTNITVKRYLTPGTDTTMMVSGATFRKTVAEDIRNIFIRNVAGFGGGDHIVRFLNASGLKIYNVVLDGVIDKSTPDRRCAATIKIGDANPAWGGVTPVGDTSRFAISNIIGNSKNTILIAGSLTDSSLSNIISNSENGEPITYRSGKEHVENVKISNLIQSKKEIPSR